MPRLFALADLHLSFAHPKPMDVFGSAWQDHARCIGENWRETVRDGDVVLIPGDISWAMRLGEAGADPDLRFVDELPGEKVLVRGNHDYWWSSPAKLRAAFPRLHFLQNNVVRFGGLAVGGTRLWDFPGIAWPLSLNETEETETPAKASTDDGAKSRVEDPEKIRARELGRLHASLGMIPPDATLRVAVTHYPPVGANGLSTSLTRLLAEYRIDIAVFGHIHGAGAVPGADTVVDGVRCILASADHVDFRPILLAEFA